MGNDNSESSATDTELQLSDLRRQYLSSRFEDVSEKGKKHRIRQIRRSIARLLTSVSASPRLGG